ncbi:glycosyltransferase family 61 protein [Oceanisphaera psychrotolerans]|uniref:glycosyltransferase family 61 protein n=1 Tax=Oceanisphaera psychrotolerans TaxID=1414654 RepID=UPI001587BB3C|nr:glycosyltransferase family 61 protein [Oceanisphaera psychrotolerans]
MFYGFSCQLSVMDRFIGSTVHNENNEITSIKNVYFDPNTPALYKDGVVVDESLLKRNVVRRQSSFNQKIAFPVADKVKPEKLKSHLPGKYIYLGSFGYNHYGHFITEQIGMIYLALMNDFNEYQLIFHPNLPGHFGSKFNSTDDFPKYIIDILSLLNLNLRRFVFLDKPTLIEEVIIPKPSFVLDNYINKNHKEVFERNIADTHYNEPTMKFNKVTGVYFSRSKLKRRRAVINESTLEDIFKSRGFLVVYPESLSAAEQIKLINSVDIISGCNGSALHSVLFRKNLN